MQANLLGTPVLISEGTAFMLLCSGCNKDGEAFPGNNRSKRSNRNTVFRGDMEAHEGKWHVLDTRLRRSDI